MATSSLPAEYEVHVPPCFMQKVQSHDRAGISTGSGSQSRRNEMLPQWQRPRITTASAFDDDFGHDASGSRVYDCPPPKVDIASSLPPFCTFTAQYLSSAILPNGSSAGLVRRLAAAS